MSDRGMRWIVHSGDGDTLGQVLARAGADPEALRDGRVFVGRRRARVASEPLRVGDELVVAPPRAPIDRGVGVLGKSGDLIAVDKPSGIPTIADHAGAAHSLQALAARALGVDSKRIHPTSRLDRDVSGVVIFATTASGAARLAHARATGVYSRRYVAIAARAVTPPSGEWTAAIGRAPDPRLRRIDGRDSVSARTFYRVCIVSPAGPALLAVGPKTGRTHQIRVHAAHAGAPLVGDRAYGGPVRITLTNGRVLAPGRIALHAARVVVPDGRGRPWTVVSDIPESLLDLGLALGIGRAEWEGAASCELHL